MGPEDYKSGILTRLGIEFELTSCKIAKLRVFLHWARPGAIFRANPLCIRWSVRLFRRRTLP
jgi:hypothetical protein